MAASLTIGGREIGAATLYDVTVDVGRDDIESQPDGSVMNARLVGLSGASVGESVVLTDSAGVLFHGWLTDQDAELDAADDMTWQVKLVAAGPLAILGASHAGAVDYPQESDTLRIIRVLDEAGQDYLINPGVIGPAIMARPAELAPAEKLARSAADDGRGVLWEQPADLETPLRYTPQRLRHWAAYSLTWGELPAAMSWADTVPLTWEDFDTDNLPGPAGTPPDLELDPATVFAEATFTQTIGDYAQSVTVTYGTAPDGTADRPSVTVGNGTPAKDYTTQLALVADATAYADDMLRRHHEATWRLEGIRIPLHYLTPADRDAIRAALTVGTRLTLPFPLGSPVGYVWQGFLEGWKHHLINDGSGDAHYLELHASERSLTEASDRWQDIAPSITWNSTAPDMRWIDALIWKAA
jgi:hypothetical protein